MVAMEIGELVTNTLELVATIGTGSQITLSLLAKESKIQNVHADMTVETLEWVNVSTQMWKMAKSLEIHTEMVVLNMLTIQVGVEIMMMRTSGQWKCAVAVMVAKQ